MDHTPIQLDLSIIIDISVQYAFNEVMYHIDLNNYFATGYCKTGRPPYELLYIIRIVLSFQFLIKATATSLTFVPVGPVMINPSTSFKAG